MSEALPADKPLVAWYGDDFTGASAVMEALTFGGVPSVLFLDTPTPAQRRRFAAYRGIGIAGIARSQNPAWMRRELPAIYRTLAALDACITLYKVCSTFDSAPELGSIGCAIDIGMTELGVDWVPLLVASPAHQRFQAFGNLFAGADGRIHRLDRHPTMNRHPATPMHEADLGRHLAQQTQKPVGLIDLATMHAGGADAALRSLRMQGTPIVSLDVADDRTLAEAGRLIWENRGDRLFAAASQGLAYALLAHWRNRGLLPPAPAAAPAARAARMVAVSGSCSPVTADQIAWALANGFRGIRLEAAYAADTTTWDGAVAQATRQALDALSEGADPLVYTALGPDDPAAAALHTAIVTAGADATAVNARIGRGLGQIVADILRQTGVQRAVIAGGDTSSHATGVLGITALTAVAPIVAGAALFEAHGDADTQSGLLIGLKGGQMGGRDYFGRIRNGG